MNSQKKVKPFNPFGGEIFDDQSEISPLIKS